MVMLSWSFYNYYMVTHKLLSQLNLIEHNIYSKFLRQFFYLEPYSPVNTVKVMPSQPLSYWTQLYPVFANSVDPDQLASEEANWSGAPLLVIQHVNLYQQSGSSNLIGWQLEVGVAS